MREYCTFDLWAILMCYDDLETLKNSAPELFDENGELDKDKMILFLMQTCYSLLDRTLSLENKIRN